MQPTRGVKKNRSSREASALLDLFNIAAATAPCMATVMAVIVPIAHSTIPALAALPDIFLASVGWRRVVLMIDARAGNATYSSSN